MSDGAVLSWCLVYQGSVLCVCACVRVYTCWHTCPCTCRCMHVWACVRVCMFVFFELDKPLISIIPCINPRLRRSGMTLRPRCCCSQVKRGQFSSRAAYCWLTGTTWRVGQRTGVRGWLTTLTRGLRLSLKLEVSQSGLLSRALGSSTRHPRRSHTCLNMWILTTQG